VVSQADRKGLVILPSDLSARCRAEALLFVGMLKRLGLPLRALADFEVGRRTLYERTLADIQKALEEELTYGSRRKCSNDLHTLSAGTRQL
jgi:hypothetical protein